MDLQHEAVVQAHGRHFDQHLAAEQLGVARLPRPGHDAPEQVLRLRGERSAVAGDGCPWSDAVAPAATNAARRLRSASR